MIKFKLIDRKKASEQVAEQIRNSIFGGFLRPGQRLPSERDLAEQFDVTRTTLREALKKLESLKLIFIRHGDRATVLDYMRHGSLDILADLLSRKDKLNTGLIENVMEARLIIGVEVTRLAVRRRTDDDLLDLEEAIVALESSLHDEDPFREAEFEFFHVLSTTSHNVFFVLLINSIRKLYLANPETFQPLLGVPEETLQNHREVVDAVRRQEADAAVDTVRSFLETGMQRVLDRRKVVEEEEIKDAARKSRGRRAMSFFRRSSNDEPSAE
jgi:GntR family transcriptional regulator, transcriptional repressor for pyruvate dehydrogenase complex